MKKIVLVLVSLLIGALGYAGIENIKQQVIYVKSVTHYVGSNINRYDLGDVDCFVEANAYHMVCLRK